MQITNKQYKPSLLTAQPVEMLDILNRKVEQVGASGLVDYIGLTDDLLKDKVERLAVAKKDIDMLIKASKLQQELIKIEVARYLGANGIDRLEGDRISSLIVKHKAPILKVNIVSEKAVKELGYTKEVVDSTLLKEALINGLEVECATLITTLIEDQIAINRRRT